MTQAVAGGKIAPPRSLEANARFDGRTPRSVSSSLTQSSRSNFLDQLDTAIDKKISGRTSAARRDVAELQDDAFKRKAFIRKKNDSSRNEVDQQRERSSASSNEAHNDRRNASSNDSDESGQSIARGRSESADLKQSQRTNEKEGSRSSDEADGPTDSAADLASDSQSTKTSSLSGENLAANDGEVLEDSADFSATTDGASLDTTDDSDTIALLVETTLTKPQQISPEQATNGRGVEDAADAFVEGQVENTGDGVGSGAVGTASAKVLANPSAGVVDKSANDVSTTAESASTIDTAALETTLDTEISNSQRDAKISSAGDEKTAQDKGDDSATADEAVLRIDAAVRSLSESTAASSQSPKSDGQPTSAAAVSTVQTSSTVAQTGSTVTTTASHLSHALTGEAKFAEQNVDRLVQSVRTQAVAKGGEMQLRLDPPELGILQVSVKMTDGVMSATFTTENANATQALSHSMQQLKQSLEAAGIAVDRIQVRQSEPAAGTSNSQSGGEQSQHRGHDQQSHQNQQERREMVRQMWRRVAMGQDSVDVVA